MPKKTHSRIADHKVSGDKSAEPESPEYAQMLGVLRQFRVVIANIKEHYREIEIETGVSGAQLWALFAISKRPRINVSELARELGVHQSTASNLLVRLMELGLIIRKREGGDLRVVTINLTRKGMRTVEIAPQPAIGMLQQALLSMPKARLASLHDDLSCLIETIGLKRATGVATPLSTSLSERKRPKR